MTLRTLAVAIAVFFVSSLALASPRNSAQEAAIDKDVGAVDPSLVATVHEGNDAMDRGDAKAAVTAYAAVHAKAPHVAAIARRLCTAEARAGDVRTAIGHCREAVAEQNDSAENHAALTVALLALTDASTADIAEARQHANAAEKLAANTELAQSTQCAVALRIADDSTLEMCSERLRTLAPTSPQTHLYIAASLANNKKDYDGAMRELDAAHALGLDDAAYGKLRQQIEARNPKPTFAMTALNDTLDVAPIVLAVWAVVSFVVVMLGMLLSDAAKRKPSRATCAAYRVVIWSAVAMFYVSAVIVGITIAGGVVLLSMMFLRIAGATHVIEAAFGAAGVYLVFVSLRTALGRLPPEELGLRLNPKKEPELRARLDAIAKRLRVDKIDDVYVVPDASLEVREIGSAWAHARGLSTYALVVGVGALDGLTVRGFEAVVASEILRYRGRDTAGGDVAIVERASLDGLAERMEARGVAIAVNPAWWYVSLYRTLFERMTDGAVELQERRADARASKSYGSEPLAKAVRHITRRRIELEARTAASIGDLLEGEEPPDDLYARELETDVRQAIDDALAEVAERIDEITALKEKGSEDTDADVAAWSLFSDREAIERAMNERLLAALHESIGDGDDQPSKAKAVARA